MPIRLNEIESVSVCILTQYKKLPKAVKINLINRMRKIYKPIGELLAGFTPDFTTPEIISATKRFEKWAYNNIHSKKRYKIIRF
jgi:hypothetical protein